VWQYIAGAFLVSAAVLWIVHDYNVTSQKASEKDALAAQAKINLIELAKTNPEVAAAIATGTGGKATPGASDPLSLLSRAGDCLSNPGVCLSPIVNYVLAGAAAYVLYKAISFGVGLKAETYRERSLAQARSARSEGVTG
jgi:hypothetical protein